MSAGWIFTLGVALLVLFAWYFTTVYDLRKRILGSCLTALLVVLCLDALLPLGEIRVRVGIEMKDPERFIVRVVPPEKTKMTKALQGKTAVSLRTRLAQLGAEDPAVTPGKDADELRVDLAGTRWDARGPLREKLMADPHLDVVSKSESIRLGLDLEGGTEFLLRLRPEAGKEITPRLVEQAVEVIRSRVDRLGVAEPVIAPAGEDRVMVQMPGLDINRIEETRRQLERVAKLEFKLVHPESDARVAGIKAGQEIIPPGYEIRELVETREGKEAVEELLVTRQASMGGDRVSSASARYGQQGYEIQLTFDGKGAEQFGSLTAKNVGNRLAIVLDGKIHSAPVIRDAIYGGTAQITGRFSAEEAQGLASVLENPLAVPVEIMQQRSISATLGTDSIRSGVFAGLAGLALVMVSVMIYYGIPGIIANVGLAMNALMLCGAMAMFGYTLTLPGIAGIVLTIGMAIDANVLIYERLREEQEAGKKLRTAIDSAYDKAFSAIFDSNITTLFTSLILIWLAVGAVKGFAVTLTIGIVSSLFSALLVTRNLFHWGISRGWIRRIRMLNLLPSRKFDFLAYRRLFVTVSAVLILASFGAMAVRGPKALSADFVGGDILMMHADKMITESQARDALKAVGLADATIQMSRSAEKVYLSVRGPKDSAQIAEEQLRKTFPEAGFKEGQVDSVGPMIGKEFAVKSLLALGLGMVVILLYVAFRFEFSFAVGGLVALVHDVIVAAGFAAITGRQLSLAAVGALLTIAGYSINDTIVIFDRIREKLLGVSRDPVEKIVNDAVNETLGRTVITSGLTFLAVLSLFVFGGPVLSDFSFIMLVGIIAGSYSTIFVATPIVLWWAKVCGRTLRREVEEARQARQTLEGA